MQNLNTGKAIHKSDLPTKTIKQNFDVLAAFPFRSVNSSIDLLNFRKNLKFADIAPAYKKNSRSDKINCRPVSILPNLSKVFENIHYKQISESFNKIFSKYQTVFQKGFNVQTCLIARLEKFRKCLDDGGQYAALLIDLSKAFNCLPDNLLKAKIHAYGFNTPLLKLIHSYLTERCQRVKRNNSFSEYHLVKYLFSEQ